ncbi:MAG: hypothetical protein HY942_00100 [Gammaproteobacteria bacterium]|nr:hypothetical protein [Gammaproteobacteria bacterium]
MVDPGEKPKHKPSQKHTLDEVLRSLQDMIRHELADVPAHQPADAARAPRAAGQDIHGDLEKALETLKSDLEGSLLRAGGSTPFQSLDSLLPALGTPPGATAPAVPPPFTPRKELPELRSAHAPPPAAGATARKEQRDLPFLDAVVPTGDAAPAPLHHDHPSPSRPGLTDLAAQTATDRAPVAPDDPLVSATLSDAEAIAREAALLADSIPVLTDAVVFPDADGEIAAEAPAQLEAPLPSPDRARDIAIQVAARLNIEMRKSGRRGLNTPAIIRLAQLLRDALAQAQPNMDNSDRDLDR